jgi:galactokinase
MTDVASLHKTEYRENPAVVASAPGVANLMGAHTEATDGLLLLFGMNRRAAVAVSARQDTSLRFFAPDIKERKRTSLSALKFRSEDRFANLAKGVVSRLQTLGAHVTGANITVVSDIPAGIGLASSQAIVDALAMALGRLYAFDVDAALAAQIGHNAERSFVGRDVGLSTFLASAVAREGTVLLVDTHTLDWTHIDFQLNGHHLIGIHTHSPSPLTEEEVARRKADCQLCTRLLCGTHGSSTLRDLSQQELYASLGVVPESARRHCLHVVAENERVSQVVAALRRDDLERVGRLMLQSHESLRDLYEVSTPEVDWLVKHAQEIRGVFGARLAGGTHSSCTLAIATAEAVEVMRERLHDYERIFGFHPDLVPCRPDDGVRIETRGSS